MSDQPQVRKPIALLLILTVLGAVALMAVPSYSPHSYPDHDAGALGTLKTIQTAQSLFREHDHENDQNFDYGSLAELSAASLVDGVTGSGTRIGYQFAVRVSPQTPEFLWMAVANPVEPGDTGDRYFATNQTGVVWYRLDAPIELRDDCEIPASARPVGK